MIRRAHVQTLGVFSLPELLTQRRRLLDLRSWFEHLQEDLDAGREIDQDPFRMVPAFYFNRSAHYEERFWRLFTGHPGALPNHFPYQFKFATPTCTLSEPRLTLNTYRVRLRGFLFPYGVVCLRATEYIEPAKPCTAEDLVAFLEDRWILDGKTTTRTGALSDLKDRVMKAFVTQDPMVDHSLFWYRLLHVDATRKLSVGKDWKELATLLAFSREPRIRARYVRTAFRNLSMDPKRQILLFGRYAGVLVTPDLWDDGRVRGRRCLRNRVAAVAELALGQRQLYYAYRTAILKLASDFTLLKGHPLQEIKQTIKPQLPLHILRVLHATLGFQEAFSTGEPDRSRWRSWFDWISRQAFAEREVETTRIEKLNEASVGLEKGAAASVSAAIDALSKLPLPKPS